MEEQLEVDRKIGDIKSQNRDEHPDWNQAPFDKMVDYIVDTHHFYLQQHLPEISKLVAKILEVHGARHAELAQVDKLFNDLQANLEQHLITEEEVLFPLVKQYQDTPSAELYEEISRINDSLTQEHEATTAVLKELRQVAKEYSIPDDACESFTRAYQELKNLEDDLYRHINLENNILFPRITKHAMEKAIQTTIH